MIQLVLILEGTIWTNLFNLPLNILIFYCKHLQSKLYCLHRPEQERLTIIFLPPLFLLFITYSPKQTRTIFTIANSHFLFFHEPIPRSIGFSTLITYFKDLPEFKALEEYDKIPDKSNRVSELKSLLDRFETASFKLLDAFLLANLMYLEKLVDKNPNLQPSQFLSAQLNGGQNDLDFIVTQINQIEILGNRPYANIIKHTIAQIRKKINQPVHHFVFALDEAQIALHILEDQVISRRYKEEEGNYPLIVNGKVNPSARRGLMALLIRYFSAERFDLPISFIFAGTSIGIAESESMISSLLKSIGLVVREEIYPIILDHHLKEILNLDDVDLPKNLPVRSRFVEYFIMNILSKQNLFVSKSKQEIVDEALKETQVALENELFQRFTKFGEDNQRWLEYLCSILKEEEFSLALSGEHGLFPIERSFDLLSVGIMYLRVSNSSPSPSNDI